MLSHQPSHNYPHTITYTLIHSLHCCSHTYPHILTLTHLMLYSQLITAHYPLTLAIIITLIYLTLTLTLTFTHSLSPTVLTMLSHLPSHNYPHTLTYTLIHSLHLCSHTFPHTLTSHTEPCAYNL